MKKITIFYIISIALLITSLIVMCAGMAFNNKAMVEVGILSALAIYGITLLPRMLSDIENDKD
jgi:hypothetical protein